MMSLPGNSVYVISEIRNNLLQHVPILFLDVLYLKYKTLSRIPESIKEYRPKLNFFFWVRIHCRLNVVTKKN